MGISFSMSDVARITGLHKNTIRNYIQRGELKGKKIDEGPGKQRWMIEEEDLRLCDIPQIAKHFSLKNDNAYLTEQERKEREYLRRIREQEERIAELTEELAQARSALRELEARTSEDYLQQKIEILDKDCADLIRAFLKMREFVSQRGEKQLKDRFGIYLEHVGPNRFAVHMGENKIEYSTR